MAGKWFNVCNYYESNLNKKHINQYPATMNHMEIYVILKNLPQKKYEEDNDEQAGNTYVHASTGLIGLPSDIL
jgi:hypothetical protein